MGVETEVKFRVSSFAQVRRKLAASGGEFLGVARQRDECFDRNGELKGRDELLRLRRAGGKCVMTFKEKRAEDSKFKERVESEFVLPDYTAAKRLFGSMGYRVWWKYAKTRESWLLRGCKVELDSLAFGKFVELEGSKPEIRRAARLLGFDFSRALTESYYELSKR